MSTKARRDEAFKQAMESTAAYTASRWPQLPKEVRSGLGVACLSFQRMTDDQKLAALLMLWQRSTVLAIDRANQVADLAVLEGRAEELTMAA